MRETVRKVGQRMVVGFDGHEASADVKRLIRQFAVGGVALFARNVAAPEQVAELVRELQSVARDAGQDQPLLIAVDQEGGRVARLRAPWTLWPPLRAVGRLGSEETARRMGKALAAELVPLGIRCDFAPVMDVDTNPKNPVIGDRSFGDDPDLVGRLGAALIAGLQEGGVAACAKHFPGHGDTELDSHLDLPRVDHSPSRLEDVELRPFRAAIAADVAMVMTCHVVVSAWEEDVPATLSARVVDDVLRRRLAYPGVIVSDDMEMKAVAARWPAGERAVRAAQAGCDLLCYCITHEAQVEAMEGLIHALEADELTWASMDDACGRIKTLKDRFVLPYQDPNPKAARQAAGAGEWVALAHEIAERSGVAL